MEIKIKENNKFIIENDIKKVRKRILKLLSTGNYAICFNEKQDIPIWNYVLNEDKTKIYVYDEDDNIIYDQLVINAPDSLFSHGNVFSNICFRNINLDNDLVTRENFYLFEDQIFNN